METVQYCKKCVTPNTRPRIEFDSEGVCNACRYAETKRQTDWNAKHRELVETVEKYRNKDGTNYDCVIAASGGKDSHFIAYYVKNILKMNPLCVTFSPSMPVDVGEKNRRNMVEKIGVDHMLITPNPKVHAQLCKIMLKEHGNVFLPWIQGIFSSVTKVAVEKNIPLIFYGEDGEAEYGGTTENNRGNFTESGIRLRVRSSRPNWKNPENWDQYGFSKKDLIPYISPSDEEVEKVGIKRMFLGSFIPWNNNQNLHYAMNVIGGFTVLDRRTTGTYTHGISIDDYIDDIYLWFLWPKFGFARATKSASPDIREGKLTRDKAIELIRKYDGEFPWYCFDKVLEYLDMSEDEFWGVVRNFMGDKDNIEREKEQAIDSGMSQGDIPNRIPAWIKIGENRWKHAGTIHGEERILELPLKRPDKIDMV
jgi:N-acetyl sugar amidotransferase